MKDRARILVIVLAAVVVGGIAGIGIYTERVAPFRMVVLRVDDDVQVRMRYFLRRVAVARTRPMDMLNVITREELILKAAAQPRYNIQVTDQDVDTFLRTVARAGGDSITDAEYREWYRQQLNETGFSDTEFRGLMLRNLTAQRLAEYLSERVETVAEQVLLHLIVFEDARTAQVARARLDAGEVFADLARELNTDERLQRSGGEWGWFPRAGLPDSLATLAFDQLAVGGHGGPVPMAQTGGGTAFAIIRVADRVAAREVTGDALEAARASAVDRWFASEYAFHQISFHGFNNGYDSETDAWVTWQLQRMRRTGQ